MLFDTELFPRVLQESYFPFSGADYLYFDEKVEFYSLNYRARKIQSFQELIYCMEVILWLNPEIEWEKYLAMAIWVSDRGNGRTIRTYSETNVERACVRVYDNKRKPYVNQHRKIIFNPAKKINKERKMQIVGKMCGGGSRRITTQSIYDVVEESMAEDVKIRLKDIAASLGVTQQTITNHVTDDIKEMIKEHNKTL